MVLTKLEVKRYEKKKGNGDYYSFAVSIDSEEFIFLRTSRDKSDIETYKNNFSEAYISDREGGARKLVLFSIEGVSTFDMDWGRRKDFPMDRRKEEYRTLNRLVGDGDLGKIEGALEKFVL